jgi:hypothetical protein
VRNPHLQDPRQARTVLQLHPWAVASRKCRHQAPDREENGMNQSMAALEAPAFQLRFGSLLHGGRALAFPCDAGGRVDLDALSPRALGNYLYARAMIGREFRRPAVVPTGPAAG